MVTEVTTNDYSDCRDAIGRWAGFHPEVNRWNEYQLRDVKQILKEGWLQFQTPPMLPGETICHVWSFLHPRYHLPLVADEWDYQLPPDFGGLNGDVDYDRQKFFYVPRMRQITPSKMIQFRSTYEPVTTFAPHLYSIDVEHGDGTEQARYTLSVYPRPNRNLTLMIPYYVLRDEPSDQFPFYPGVSAHASTIRSSCLAAAERILNDVHEGPEWMTFMNRLRTSVEFDRRQKKSSLGYNINEPRDVSGRLRRRAQRRANLYGSNSVIYVPGLNN